MVTQNCGIIFFTENLTELFSCGRACAASKLVERWTLKRSVCTKAYHVVHAVAVHFT